VLSHTNLLEGDPALRLFEGLSYHTDNGDKLKKLFKESMEDIKETVNKLLTQHNCKFLDSAEEWNARFELIQRKLTSVHSSLIILLLKISKIVTTELLERLVFL
jgi:hypothetical protein